MRLLILKDKDIKDDHLTSVLADISSLYEVNTKIVPKYTILSHDYTEVSGDIRVTFDSLPYGYLKKNVELIHKRDKYAYDHIVFLVHKKNWKPTKKVWGENFSNVFYNYHVEVCRFDDTKLVNSIGTLYHEIHHSHDALIETMLGIKIEPLIKVKDWDEGITHGGEAPWSYIRYRENQSSLAYIAPYLRQAYDKSYQLHLKEKISLLKQVVKLAQRVAVLKRSLLVKNISKCHSQSLV